MRISGWKSALASTAFVLGIAVLLGASPAPRGSFESQAAAALAGHEIALTFEPAQTKVNYMVESTLHTVHGTFQLKRGNLRLDLASGKAEGELVVDAASGNSGNSSCCTLANFSKASVSCFL